MTRTVSGERGTGRAGIAAGRSRSSRIVVSGIGMKSPGWADYAPMRGTDRGAGSSHHMAGPPDRQGGPAVTGMRGTRITRPAPDKTIHTHPSPSRLRIPQRAHSNLDEQRRQGDIHASGARTSRGTEPASRGLPDPRRARGLAGRRTGGHGEGQRGLAEREHFRQRAPLPARAPPPDQRGTDTTCEVLPTASTPHATPVDLQPDDVTVTVAFRLVHVGFRLSDRPGVGQHVEQDAESPPPSSAPTRARPRVRLAIVGIGHRSAGRRLRRPRARRPRQVRRLRRRRRAQRRPPSPPPSTRSSRRARAAAPAAARARARRARRTSPNSA